VLHETHFLVAAFSRITDSAKPYALMNSTGSEPTQRSLIHRNMKPHIFQLVAPIGLATPGFRLSRTCSK
jgi:hypothetical protein